MSTNLIINSLLGMLGLLMLFFGTKAIRDREVTLVSKNFPFREERRELMGAAAIVFGVFHSLCGVLIVIWALLGILQIEIQTIFWNGLCALFLIFIIQTAGIILAGLIIRRIKTA